MEVNNIAELFDDPSEPVENVSVDNNFLSIEECNESPFFDHDYEPNDRYESISRNSIFKELSPKIHEKLGQVFSESYEKPSSWLTELRFEINCLYGKMLNTINSLEHNVMPSLKNAKYYAGYACPVEERNIRQRCDCFEADLQASTRKLEDAFQSERRDDQISRNDLTQILKEMLDIITKMKSLVPKVEEYPYSMIPSSTTTSTPSSESLITKPVNSNSVIQNSYLDPYTTQKRSKFPRSKKIYLEKIDIPCVKHPAIKPKKLGMNLEYLNAGDDLQSEKGTIYYDCKTSLKPSNCSIETLSSNNSPKRYSLSKPHKVTIKNSSNFRPNKYNSRPLVPTATKVVSSPFNYLPLESDCKPHSSSRLESDCKPVLLSNKPINISYEEILPNRGNPTSSCDGKNLQQASKTNEILNTDAKMSSVKSPNNLIQNKVIENEICKEFAGPSVEDETLVPNNIQTKIDGFDLPAYMTTMKKIQDRDPLTQREVEYSHGKPVNLKFDFMEYYSKVVNLKLKYDNLKKTYPSKSESDSKECVREAARTTASAEQVQILKTQFQNKFYEEFKEYFEKLKDSGTSTLSDDSQMSLNVDQLKCSEKNDNLRPQQETPLSSTPISEKLKQTTDSIIPSSQKTIDDNSRLSHNIKNQTPTRIRKSFDNLMRFMSPSRYFKNKVEK